MKHLLKRYLVEPAFIVLASHYIYPLICPFLPKGHSIVNYPGGKIFIDLRESHMMLKRSLGIYEYWKTALFLELVKPGMTVVDIGVNKGYYSLLAAKIMHDRGTVLSFEPDPVNCGWIKKSIEINGYQSVKLFQKALSNVRGTHEFYRGKKSGWGSLFFSASDSVPETDPITVETHTLDDVLDEEGIDAVDVIKMDVQGADLLVLQGAKETLTKSKNLSLIMDVDVKTREDKESLFGLLKDAGFEVFSISRKLEPIDSLDNIDKDILATKCI